MQTFLFDTGAQWILWIQSWGAWLETPMHLFSFLGEEIFYLLILPLVYWCYDQKLGIRIGVTLLTASSLNSALKLAWHMPRPYWYRPNIKALSLQSSFGAPSGHAQLSASVWGISAYDIRKKIVWGITLAIIFMIGISRLYLGVHFVHDVLLGWLIGALTVWALVLIWPRAEGFIRRQGSGKQAIYAFGLSLIYLFINWLPWQALQNWQMPVFWQNNILQWSKALPQPVSLNTALSSAGTLFGFLSGLIWLHRRGGFAPQAGSFRQKILRYMLGVIGLMIIWYGLGKVFPRDETWLAFTLRYIRYSLIGFWVGGLAPLWFKKLSL